MTIFVTSDTHYRHANIIKYCNRPFKDLDHMTEVLVSNWNSIVSPDDTVWHLGDFAMGGNLHITTPTILARLNGTKYLIKGNHDGRGTIEAEGWAGVFSQIENVLAEAAPVPIYYVMQHYNPEMSDGTWPSKDAGSVLLHGHSHGNSHGRIIQKNVLDVGVDCHNYFPITLEYAIEQALLEPTERTNG